MATYKSASELEGKVLEQGDKVVFVYQGKEYPYTVCWNHLSFDLGFDNDVIFKALGVDKFDFAKQGYGYPSTGGIWPTSQAEDFRALTSLVLILFYQCQHDSVARYIIIRAPKSTPNRMEPATRPHIHLRFADALEEAQRLAGQNSNYFFNIFELSVRCSTKPVEIETEFLA